MKNDIVHWNTIWKQAMTQCFFPQIASPMNRTVVFQVTSPLSGTKLRIGFCNWYGGKDQWVRDVTVKIEDRIYDVTLCRGKEFSIPQGTKLQSDALDVTVTQGEVIEVRLLLGTHAVDMNYIEENTVSFSGDHLHDVVLPVYSYKKLTDRLQLYRVLPVIDTIEVGGERPARKIMAFGDSITALGTWTRPLSRRLLEAYGGKYILLNVGISGNCLIFEQHGIISRSYGQKGIERFARDVLSERNIHAVIFSIGTNDISYMKDQNKADISLERLISATRKIFALLGERNIRVVATTVLPRMGSKHYTSGMDKIRKSYNQWLANCEGIDYLLDWNAIGQDREQPEYLRADFHVGDHLHPSAAGGQELADSFDLSRLIGS